MGNSFGHIFENAYNLYMHPDITPSPLDEPSYDPNFGFPNGRVERVSKATKEELISAKVPLNKRDYCAHLGIAYKACRKDHWPFAVKCSHEKHAYLNCEYEE
ncbi:NADH dehydrogenase [ubiquinone] 1 beta subcomplex subunit 7-like [Agrilus planipennis]|uniref:NADH dehydrogenase [ubiquinone] 1 beta subcomplex subunit 7 n=1 Tax=Agrilus planipennis TaxID=224129 RepID=A0A7F5R4K2_AGRPL|nr:NADH dehydrogenase [ubiquinone] 1 beta subcomplex subunit 7-like [Agrilus planipennis]XP_025834580.1 NADH dehydrogenase [ubiquinone] 1 beta subcomplex subunit 7-like [Agrilus planipennis]